MHLSIIFAIVCIACLVWAVREWGSAKQEASGPPPDRNTWREALFGLCITLLWLATIWVAADANGWGRDRALWLGFGSFVAVMTVIRPRWYWNNYRARWLRDLIGDTATAAFYLLVAALMIWVGLFTSWTFGRQGP
jgi:hypothetical protein